MKKHIIFILSILACAFTSCINWGNVDPEPSFQLSEHTWYFARKWGLKTGIRSEYSDYVSQWNVSPRLSLAYKINRYHNVSAFYGEYFQSPIDEIGYQQPKGFMKSRQYLANYFYQKDKQTIRIEAYQKDYRGLIRNSNE